MKHVLHAFTLFLLPFATAAQAVGDLDFWLGEWDAVWEETDSTRGTGRNTVSRELNGKVVAEHFVILSGREAGFEGRSWSVPDAASGTWKQTWVDNEGGYIDLGGGKEGETFVFQRRFTGKKGLPVLQKMVFSDIEPGRFTWDWMSSTDEGKTWNTNWRIRYTRRTN